jgi:hypothetical protein
MWKVLKTWLSRLRPAEPEIALEADGFSVVRRGTLLFRVRWAEVLEVFAFKENWGTYDRICLGFRVSDAGDYYRVDEDTPGYPGLLEELARVYPDLDKNWWLKVAFPAFATNFTTVWGQPSTAANEEAP